MNLVSRLTGQILDNGVAIQRAVRLLVGIIIVT